MHLNMGTLTMLTTGAINDIVKSAQFLLVEMMAIERNKRTEIVENFCIC